MNAQPDPQALSQEELITALRLSEDEFSQYAAERGVVCVTWKSLVPEEPTGASRNSNSDDNEDGDNSEDDNSQPIPILTVSLTPLVASKSTDDSATLTSFQRRRSVMRSMSRQVADYFSVFSIESHHHAFFDGTGQPVQQNCLVHSADLKEGHQPSQQESQQKNQQKSQQKGMLRWLHARTTGDYCPPNLTSDRPPLTTHANTPFLHDSDHAGPSDDTATTVTPPTSSSGKRKNKKNKGKQVRFSEETEVALVQREVHRKQIQIKQLAANPVRIVACATNILKTRATERGIIVSSESITTGTSDGGTRVNTVRLTFTVPAEFEFDSADVRDALVEYMLGMLSTLARVHVSQPDRPGSILARLIYGSKTLFPKSLHRSRSSKTAADTVAAPETTAVAELQDDHDRYREDSGDATIDVPARSWTRFFKLCRHSRTKPAVPPPFDLPTVNRPLPPVPAEERFRVRVVVDRSGQPLPKTPDELMEQTAEEPPSEKAPDHAPPEGSDDILPETSERRN